VPRCVDDPGAAAAAYLYSEVFDLKPTSGLYSGSGVLEYWSIGVLEYWSIGVLEYWSIGVLGYLGIGVGGVEIFTLQ
jgi:hypothetical protein